MSTYECSITNTKKQLEFYKQLSEQLQQLSEQLQQENQELKKQLEEKENLACRNGEIALKRRTQQKEFINWLEDCMENKAFLPEEAFGKVLSKYKEIIGGKNE